MRLREFLDAARLEQLRAPEPAEPDPAEFRDENGALNMDVIARYANQPRVIGGENGAGILVVPRGYTNLPGLTPQECERAWSAWCCSEEFLAAVREWCSGTEHLFADRQPPVEREAPVHEPSANAPEPAPAPPRVRRTLRR